MQENCKSSNPPVTTGIPDPRQILTPTLSKLSEIIVRREASKIFANKVLFSQILLEVVRKSCLNIWIKSIITGSPPQTVLPRITVRNNQKS